MIKRIFSRFQRTVLFVLDILVKVILTLVYALLVPFFFLLGLKSDFLELKTKKCFWHQRKKIGNVEDFLKHQ